VLWNLRVREIAPVRQSKRGHAMKLETVSKIKGWVALGCLLIWIGLVFLLDPLNPNPEVGIVDGLFGLLCIGFSISWLRQRRRMRDMEYQARQFKNG
jgi:hypothetical protein